MSYWFYIILTLCNCITFLGIAVDKQWVKDIGVLGNFVMIGYALRYAVEVLAK